MASLVGLVLYIVPRIGRMIKASLTASVKDGRKLYLTTGLRRNVGRLPPIRHARRMLLLEGCVQPALDSM